MLRSAALLRLLLRAGLLACALLLTVDVRADEPPLHERIDALVESSAPGPLAPVCSDADFLRRIYLDLSGRIPDAATARAFLDDASPDKRRVLVERLLAAPEFDRHMQHTFDVMWMERRGQTSIPVAEWQEYLRKSFRENKPLDQLSREILAADGVDAALRPAARFYLDRDAEANLITRDVGRLFFGRDLQCAQCHDHPLVNDYLQSEYYGLMAFVTRGTLFADEKEKKSYYAELGEGEVNFKSVFTGNARDRVSPQLPGGTPVSEPVLAKDEQYVVAPAKGVRPIPKFSRRAQLAALATSGNAPFNRNLANRLWAHMLGRGLVHPLDMQHSANPAVSSSLLSILSDELVRLKFDTRAFLRELALSKTYQRTSEEPLPASPSGDLAAQLAGWKAEVTRLDGELPKLEQAAGQIEGQAATAYEAFSKAATAREAADKARAEAKKASDEVSAALAAAVKDVAAQDEIVKSLVAARVAADAAVAKLPDDKQLIEAATTFKNRANEVDTQLAASKKTVSEKTPQVQAASLKLADTDQALAAATSQQTQAQAAFDAAEAQVRTAIEQHRTALASRNELAARVADAETAGGYAALQAAIATSEQSVQSAAEQLASLKTQMSVSSEQLAAAEAAVATAQEKLTADRTAAQSAWNEMLARAETRFALAVLKPLTPEQMAWATMQALGIAEQQRAALLPEVQKELDAANVPAEQRPLAEARRLEERVDEKLRGHIGSFVSLFGQQPGQAPTFQATVHQALFLSNGGLLAGWLNPGGNNLTERLAKLEDPQALAEELYLSVLTRRPSDEERAAVAAYWEAATADRAAAAREMVWSLLASAEFRFNH